MSGVVYAAEFIADKISWFDSLWDAIHTFIQPLGAAIVGATAMSVVDPVYVEFDFPLHARRGVIAPDDQAQAGARSVDNAHDARSTTSRMLMLRAARFSRFSENRRHSSISVLSVRRPAAPPAHDSTPRANTRHDCDNILAFAR